MIFRAAPWAFLFGNGFVLAACAAPAIIVEPTTFSGELYNELTCDQLGQEQVRLTQSLTTVSKQQETIRQERALELELGLELGIGIPLAVAGVFGGADAEDLDLKPEALGFYDDLSPEIARLKGEIKAVKRTASLKCQKSTPLEQITSGEQERISD